MKSLGFVEVSGVTAAIDALDIMCKSADVSLVSWERKLGGRLVTLMIEGQVSAVSAAVANACAQCIKKPVAHAVIANPHPEVVRLVELSASRLKKVEKKAEEVKPEPVVAEKAPAAKKPTSNTAKRTTKKSNK